MIKKIGVFLTTISLLSFLTLACCCPPTFTEEFEKEFEKIMEENMDDSHQNVDNDYND